MYSFNLDERKEQRRLLLLLTVVFMVIFSFSELSPLVADDYNYSFSLSTGTRVDSVYEIFKSLEVHRSEINGRYFSHFFAYFFLWKPKYYFNFINALMSAALVWIASRYIKLTGIHCVSFATLLWASIYFILVPVFGQLFLWLDGACNYSWAEVFILLYLLPFCASWLRQPLHFSTITGMLYILEAFVAGAYSENASLAVLIISSLLVLAQHLRKEKTSFLLILALISAGCGYLFLFLSPMQTNGNRGSLSLSSAAERILTLLYRVPVRGWVILSVALILLTMGILLLHRKHRKLYTFLQIFLTVAYVVLLLVTSPDFYDMPLLSIVRTAISCSTWNIITISYLFCVLFLE